MGGAGRAEAGAVDGGASREGEGLYGGRGSGL